MSPRSSLARTVACSLAIAALAAPAALARPATPDWPAGNAQQARIVQHLRSPDAEDAAALAVQTKGRRRRPGALLRVIRALDPHPAAGPPVGQRRRRHRLDD